MLRSGLAAGFADGAVWAMAAEAMARAMVARAAAGHREGMRMGANVAPVFRQNRGKIDAISDPNSRPVIGVSGKKLLGAVELFGQHRPGKQVGPGHGAEREHQGGSFQQRFRVPIGAADQESDI